MDMRNTTEVKRSRRIERMYQGEATRDGAGVRLTRLLSQGLQGRLDPFLMLDFFGSNDATDYLAGFPDHPHRGFETITYMLEGRMRHRDNAGHEGLLATGGMQWMVAGSGVVHSEMPEQEAGRMAGFQLWLNLPARDKMTSPWYRDFAAADLPRASAPDGARVMVLAGATQGVAGAVQRPVTEPLILDLQLPAGASWAQPLASDHHAFAVLYAGRASIAGEALAMERLAVLGDDPSADGVIVSAREDARVFLVAGRPLREPIVQYGPFVMNTREEIAAAVQDLREGRFV
nr:pirin family protein [Acidiferrobacter sp. SPIII_3]